MFERLDLIINIITAAVNIITVFAIIFALVQIKINRKQLFLATITKCVSDFRNLEELQNDTKETHLIKNYIDLVNEELFYFQHKYLPVDISKEWIDGMIGFMPITDRFENILNKNYVIKHLSENRKEFLLNFPRIQNAFEVYNKYDFDLIYSDDHTKRYKKVKERENLINEILRNVKKFKG